MTLRRTSSHVTNDQFILKHFETITDTKIRVWAFSSQASDKPIGVSLSGIEVGNGAILRGTFGSGETVSAALLDYFQQLTKLKANEYLVSNATGGPDRRHFRWNGVSFVSLHVERRP